jgi:DNA/RNA endonuclease G (NUC1)
MSSKLRNVSSHAASALVGAISSLTIVHTIVNDRGKEKEKELKSNNTGIHSNINNGPTSTSSAVGTSINTYISPPHPSSSLPSIQSPITIFQPNPYLQIAYDARTKNPVYSMEKICYKPKLDTKVDTDNITRTGKVNSNSNGNGNGNGNDDNTSNNKSNSKRQNYNFYESKLLSPHHRSRNSYYKHSGYDRGHLAPAADFNNHNSNNSNSENSNPQEYKLDTFSLTNISPQRPNFNRKIWLRLEEWTRSLVNKYETDIYVISGPIWLPSSKKYRRKHQQKQEQKEQQQQQQYRQHEKDVFHYSYDGIGSPPSIIHIPTHFFKVVFTLNDDDSSTTTTATTTNSTNGSSEHNFVSSRTVNHFAAFVIPHHHDYDHYRDHDHKKELLLSDCIVNIQDLEAVTGISFFPFHGIHTSMTNHDHNGYNQKRNNNNDDNEYSLLEVFDLLTELVRYADTNNKDDIQRIKNTNQNNHEWMMDSTKKNMNSTCSKRLKSIQKKLERYNDDVFILPKHFCANRRCDQIVLQQIDGPKVKEGEHS